MHVLVTGAAGLIGSHVMVALLDQGHSVLASDINPLPPVVIDQIQRHGDRVQQVTGDLTRVDFVDQLFASSTTPLDGVMHIGGIRSPVGLDPRLVHNINVVATYNILQTAAAKGIKRIVQASSCNALGLSWTSPEHWGLDAVPLNEESPMRPPVQTQAAAIHRYYPDVRIASIRMHFTRSSINETTSSVKHTGLWSWSSVDAVLRGCILGLTSEGWTGAESFHIAADEIFYPASLSDGVEVSALDLLEKHWPGRVKTRVLGWKHDL
ncbi:hypothetical protein IAU60_003171 [Kwoniella sp. DSM 27419]